MSPWDMIGWFIVGWLMLGTSALLFRIGIGLWQRFSEWLGHMRRHYKTRHILPQRGQWWRYRHWGGEWKDFEVTYIHENGHVSLKSFNVGWGLTSEQWRERVLSDRMYLLKEAVTE